jgi:hypothetical protein
MPPCPDPGDFLFNREYRREDMSKKQHVVQERSTHEYFTMLPNIYDDINLSRLEHRLLTHYARVGNCYESVRTTAGRCKMGVASVIEARKSLDAKGWIRVGKSEYQTLEIQVVDVWELNTAIYGGAIDEPQRAIASLQSVSELKHLLEGVSEAERSDSKLKRGRFKSETKEDLIKKTTKEEEKERKKLIKEWERSASGITPGIAQDLYSLADECEEHRLKLPPGSNGSDFTGNGWVIEAIQTARKSASGKFNTKYVQAILDRWIRGKDFWG